MSQIDLFRNFLYSVRILGYLLSESDDCIFQTPKTYSNKADMRNKDNNYFSVLSSSAG